MTDGTATGIEESARQLATALAAADSPVLVITGAGVSAASGISTFRGSEPGAVWRQHDVSMATAETYERDPRAQLAWYLERFAAVDTARPNPAHHALAALERHFAQAGRPFTLVTQNIDTLHERAGSHSLIKVHGTADRLRCGAPGCPLGAPRGSIARCEIDIDAFRRDPQTGPLPACPRCSTPLRAHVLFFDEYYSDHADYRYAEVEAAADNAGCMLFVGTSFAVGVTSLLLAAGGRRGIPMWSIDPEPTRLPDVARVQQLAARAESLLPVVVSALRAA